MSSKWEGQNQKLAILCKRWLQNLYTIDIWVSKCGLRAKITVLIANMMNNDWILRYQFADEAAWKIGVQYGSINQNECVTFNDEVKSLQFAMNGLPYIGFLMKPGLPLNLEGHDPCRRFV